MWFIGLIVAVIAGILWAVGGDHRWSKNWRRWGVPIAIALYGMASGFLSGVVWYLVVVLSVLVFGLLIASIRIGYGIPDDPTKPNPDKGSPLGKFFFDMAYDPDHGREFGQAEAFANKMTRLVCGLAYGGSVSILSFMSFHWGWVIVVPILVACWTAYVNAIMEDIGPIVTLNGREVLTGIGVGLGALIALL